MTTEFQLELKQLASPVGKTGGLSLGDVLVQLGDAFVEFLDAAAGHQRGEHGLRVGQCSGCA